MPSKGDFIDLLREMPWGNSHGIHCLWAFHPLVWSFVKQDLVKKIPLKVVFAQDLSVASLEREFLELDFFSEQQSFMVLEADKMSSDCVDLLANEFFYSKLENQSLFLCFSAKKSLKKFLGKEHLTTFHLEDAKFWEYSKVVHYLCKKHCFALPEKFYSSLLDLVGNDLLSLDQQIAQLVLHFHQNNITWSKVEKLLMEKKIDYFAMNRDFCNKKFLSFYRRLWEMVDQKPDEVIGYLSFLQAHLFKVMDPSYMNAKKKLSSYDNQIKQAAAHWKKSDLTKAMEYFSGLLVCAKKKQLMLKTNIQAKVLHWEGREV